MTSRTVKGVAALALATAVAVPVAAQANTGHHPSRQEAHMHGYSLLGTWQVTVVPNGQPSFESTISYNGAHTMAEATDKGPMSGGLGAWVETGRSHYRTTFQKYRFDSTGTYIGKTVVAERIHVTGPASYSTTATTQIVDPTGHVMSTFTSTATAERITP